MENLLKNIEVLREQVLETMRLLDIERKGSEAHELKVQMSASNFWDNQEKAVAISQAADDLTKEVKEWDDLSLEIRDLEELIAEGQREIAEAFASGQDSDEGFDEGFANELRDSFKKLKEKFNRLEFFVMFSGKYDAGNTILSIHAGTGGVDAQDWAEILMRMFLRFSEKMNFKTEMINLNRGNEAGIKSCTIAIKGRYSYGYLQSESGVHRLVRISSFDAEAMRHTSFALVEVIPELPDAHEIEINDADIEIDVFRSSGPGGQGVNTTDSAVRIKHKASNIVVICQNERSQHQNKETAMKVLKSKLFKLAEEKRETEERKIKGEAQKAEWGKQIRSYVMQPYKMVKDHRTEHETQDIDGVLDGDLRGFMEAYLRWNRS